MRQQSEGSPRPRLVLSANAEVAIALALLAEEEGRSLSSMIHHIVQGYLRERGRLPKAAPKPKRKPRAKATAEAQT